MKLVDVKTDGGILRSWDLIQKVGRSCPNSKMDVKFCQYMLYKVNRRLLLSDVIGVWGPKSTAALAGWEKGAKGITQDGIIDVIPPGSDGRGTISHKFYKLFTMQMYYVSDMSGIKDLDKARQYSIATQEILMGMPEDCLDMPSDLSHDMIRARDEVYAS